MRESYVMCESYVPMSCVSRMCRSFGRQLLLLSRRRGSRSWRQLLVSRRPAPTAPMSSPGTACLHYYLAMPLLYRLSHFTLSALIVLTNDTMRLRHAGWMSCSACVCMGAPCTMSVGHCTSCMNSSEGKRSASSAVSHDVIMPACCETRSFTDV